jgi:UDP-glucose 4-epimerase
VTGGAGYVGSHVVRELIEQGEHPIVLDDLSTGHRVAAGEAELVLGDFGDRDILDAILPRDVEFIVHMAALCEVSASIADPAAYYATNLARSLTLLDAARDHGVAGLILSSTAAVYGAPERVPIPEDHPKRPTNPYGETKLALERVLHWYDAAYGLRYISLRYFNAVGAHPDGTIGEDHANETHLIPRLLRSVIVGGEAIPVFGTDYPTPDGTCVRDYVHVMDLARAHVAALSGLRQGSFEGGALNLGNGAGYSVRQVVDSVHRITESTPRTVDAPRRLGDPATLVAASERARERLGWAPRFTELDRIVQTAWAWHRAHPNGFGDPPRRG